LFTQRLKIHFADGFSSSAADAEWWARQDSNLQPDRYERQGSVAEWHIDYSFQSLALYANSMKRTKCIGLFSFGARIVVPILSPHSRGFKFVSSDLGKPAFADTNVSSPANYYCWSFAAPASTFWIEDDVERRNR